VRAPAPGRAPQTGFRTDRLTVAYGDRVAVRDASIAVGGGELVGIVGPNGAGKSTLIKAVVGLVPVRSGTIELTGAPRRSAGRRIAYVAQRADLDWTYPAQVREVVAMGRYPHLGGWRRPRGEDRHAVDRALDRLGLTDLARRAIGELSGGQAQRVFLARAFAQEAPVLLLDEPFAGVDATSAAVLDRELRAAADEGAAVCVVSHDLAASPERFDRVVLLAQRVVAAGPPAQVLTDAHLAAAYGSPTAAGRAG
jgi:ABC-type Mn2+/Zn2+ transport system ATPase subunit